MKWFNSQSFCVVFWQTDVEMHSSHSWSRIEQLMSSPVFSINSEQIIGHHWLRHILTKCMDPFIQVVKTYGWCRHYAMCIIAIHYFNLCMCFTHWQCEHLTKTEIRMNLWEYTRDCLSIEGLTLCFMKQTGEGWTESYGEISINV